MPSSTPAQSLPGDTHGWGRQQAALLRVSAFGDETCGTAVAIDSGGYAITASHLVVRDDVTATDVQLGFENETVPAAVQQILRGEGIALLRFDRALRGVRPLSVDLPSPERASGVSVSVASHQGVLQASIQSAAPRKIVAGDGTWGATRAGAAVLDHAGALYGVLTNPPTQSAQEGDVSLTADWGALLDVPEAEPLFLLVQSSDAKDGPRLLDDAEAVRKQLAARSGKFGLRVLPAVSAIATPGRFAAAVRDLCRARVAIFDGSRFEPAVMLLLGIRAVVRRGVTIISTNSNPGDDVLGPPFNIKDANFVVHGASGGGGREPWERMLARVETGLKQTGAPEYADLPAYNGVRELPPGERSPVLAEDGVLLLGSFQKSYVEDNYEYLKTRYRRQQRLVRIGKNLNPSAELGVVRSLELDSPRLVSHAIYAAIRRWEFCVVDWTDWRPNVFFELGVRIAASDGRTVSVIDRRSADVVREIQGLAADAAKNRVLRYAAERNWANSERDHLAERLATIAPQCELLMSLFAPSEYATALSDPLHTALDGSLESEGQSACQRLVRRVAEVQTNPSDDPAAVPLHRELLRLVRLLAADDTEGMSAMLFPRNDGLRAAAESARRQRTTAAWDALTESYGVEEIVKDDLLRSECQKLIELLTSDRNSGTLGAKDPDWKQVEAFRVRLRATRPKRSRGSRE